MLLPGALGELCKYRFESSDKGVVLPLNKQTNKPGALLRGLKSKPEFSDRGNTFKMETIRKKAKLFVQPKIHINNYRCFTTILHLMVYSMLQLKPNFRNI